MMTQESPETWPWPLFSAIREWPARRLFFFSYTSNENTRLGVERTGWGRQANITSVGDA